MTKIPGIGKIPVRSVLENTPKRNIKIGESGLPLEMPLDTFQKEKQLINKLEPSTPYNNALNSIQNKLLSLKKQFGIKILLAGFPWIPRLWKLRNKNMENEKIRFSDLTDEQLYLELNNRLKELEAEEYDFPNSSVEMVEEILQTA